MRSDESFIEQARRRQIITAAIRLLADGGYSAASLSAIATRIGVSKGVISYHFDGKDELLAQVVTSVLADAAAFMAPRVAAADDPLTRLRSYVRANLDYLGDHRLEVRALTAVLAGLPPDADGAPAYAAAGRDAVQTLAALLAAGQRDGSLRDFDTGVAARSLRAAIDAVTELLRVEPDLDVDAYATQLLDLFEPALRA